MNSQFDWKAKIPAAPGKPAVVFAIPESARRRAIDLRHCAAAAETGDMLQLGPRSIVEGRRNELWGQRDNGLGRRVWSADTPLPPLAPMGWARSPDPAPRSGLFLAGFAVLEKFDLP
jgi:hypothetical protein